MVPDVGRFADSRSEPDVLATGPLAEGRFVDEHFGAGPLADGRFVHEHFSMGPLADVKCATSSVRCPFTKFLAHTFLSPCELSLTFPPHVNRSNRVTIPVFLCQFSRSPSTWTIFLFVICLTFPRDSASFIHVQDSEK
ncbi:hypothetical protein ACOMHN_063217 [Nucella lapillus]